jgi:hypothetical protein
MPLEDSRPNSNFSYFFYTLRPWFVSFVKKFWIPKFHKFLKDGILVMGDQELEENFSLHMYESSFIILIIGFGDIGYSMRNNKVREYPVDMVFVFPGKIAQNPKLNFR